MPVVQHLASRLARYIYVLEKDTKNLLQYDRQSNRVVRQRLNYRVNNMDVQLPHNYQCIQVGEGPHVFLIGGGDYNQTPQSMYECHELKFNQQTNLWDCFKKANMRAPRHGHSACAFMAKYALVSGSRKDIDFSARKVELYDVENNVW